MDNELDSPATSQFRTLIEDVNAALTVALWAPSIRTRAEVLHAAATVIQTAGQLIYVALGLSHNEERSNELHDWADNAAADLVVRAMQDRAVRQ